MANSASFFDVKKIEQAAKKASEKGIADATRYLWKVARNSVKKSAGTEKKHDLKMFLGRKQGDDTETIEQAKKYLNSPNRANEQIVVRDSKYNVRDPKEKGSHRHKKPSGAGKPPKSHKTDQKGWRDHWLREGIRFNPKTGTVFVNPARNAKGYPGAPVRKLPALIEEGGNALSHVKILEGYFVHKTHYKNGKATVSYTPKYRRKVKRYHMQARPFMKPALEKAAKKLLEILKRGIVK